jgi:hypothetical protein
VAKVVPNDEQERFGFIYDPEAGMMRLTREMRTRLDIPDAETFLRQLAALQDLGEANRRAQMGASLPAQPAASSDGETRPDVANA